MVTGGMTCDYDSDGRCYYFQEGPHLHGNKETMVSSIYLSAYEGHSKLTYKETCHEITGARQPGGKLGHDRRRSSKRRAPQLHCNSKRHPLPCRWRVEWPNFGVGPCGGGMAWGRTSFKQWLPAGCWRFREQPGPSVLISWKQELYIIHGIQWKLL